MQHGIKRAGQGIGIIPAEMQATAFMTSLGAIDDEVRSENKIAQFNQIIADAKLFVVLGNFLFQQDDTV